MKHSFKIFTCFTNQSNIRIIGTLYRDNWIYKVLHSIGFIHFLIELFALKTRKKVKSTITITQSTGIQTKHVIDQSIFDIKIKISKPIEYVKLESSELEASTMINEILHIHSTQPGLISDIDDTVFQSHSTRRIKKIWHFIFKKISARKPFSGIQEFFNQALSQHFDVFYVSSSSYLLYDLILNYFEKNNFPTGVYLLRKTKYEPKAELKHIHKKHRIQEIFKMFPDKQFVLLGDSGQEDQVIYSSIYRQYKNQVKYILIRNIGKHSKPQSAASDIPLYYFDHYDEVRKLLKETL